MPKPKAKKLATPYKESIERKDGDKFTEENKKTFLPILKDIGEQNQDGCFCIIAAEDAKDGVNVKGVAFAHNMKKTNIVRGIIKAFGLEPLEVAAIALEMKVHQ